MAETRADTFELLGDRTRAEGLAWIALEERGFLGSDELDDILGDSEGRVGFDLIVARRLAFRSPSTGRIHALSQLARHLL